MRGRILNMESVAAAAVARMARLVRCAQAHARQRRIYARLLRKHGGWRAEAPHEVHHWGSAQQQARRFEVILEMAGPRQLRNSSVADIGCGCGDLLAFLRRNGATPREYVGYDIVPEMVAEAQRRFGADDRVSFECRDVALRPPNRTFDFVLSSGIFAFGNRDFFEQMAFASFGGWLQRDTVHSTHTGCCGMFVLTTDGVTDMAETAYIFNLFEGKGYE